MILKSNRKTCSLFVLLCTMIVIPGCMDKHCPDKEVFLKNFDSFVNKIEIEHETMSEEKWLYHNKTFRKYVNNCYKKYKEEMSFKERIAFLKNAITYNYYFNDEESLNIEMEGLELDLEKEMDELGEEAKYEMKDYLKKEFGDDIEKVVDDFLDGLNNVGEQIKDWLKTGKD